MKTMRFEGTGIEYFKIWIVNILLIILTLGIYYPWAKVRSRRYFLANSSIDGRNFDYHATGKQLFLGYLIAMCLLIVYVLIQNIFPIGGIIVMLILFAAYPWIIWRSLKFNSRMTSLSNVRFSFEALLGGAYVNYMLLPIAVGVIAYMIPTAAIVTVVALLKGSAGLTAFLVSILVVAMILLLVSGIAFLKKCATSYMINGHRFGQGIFSANLTSGKFIAIGFRTAGLGLLLYVGLLVFLFLSILFTVGASGLMEMQSGMDNPETVKDMMSGSFVVIMALIYLGFIFGSFLVAAYSYSRQRAYILSETSLDGKITFASTLSARSFSWLMISNFLLVIFTLGLAMPWARIRAARLVLSNTQIDLGDDFEGYMTEKLNEQSSLGEQIGDAFDINVDVGI